MTAATVRAYRGPVLFSFGFRPFFLCAGLWGALAVPIWIAAFLIGGGMVLGEPGRDWHVHEMLFGYLAAVITGFLLTAVPNWTGRLPVTGAPLMGLFALWCAGRAAMLLETRLGAVAAAIDCAFLTVFALMVWREVLAGRSWRNLPVCLIVSVFALANVGFHLRPIAPALAAIAERLALTAPAMLIALVGGRIIPSFTRNWLAQRKAVSLPAPFGRIDQAAIALTGAAVLAWIILPEARVVGGLLILAGAGNLVRLARWRGLSALGEPLVWILHVGYLWLALALALLGTSILALGAVPRTAGIHALTAGAIGVMTLAVMTRATLGHTGQPRVANRGTLTIYLLANAAALMRITAPFAVAQQPMMLAFSAVLWSLAFAFFVLVYGPLLVGRAPSKAA